MKKYANNIVAIVRHIHRIRMNGSSVLEERAARASKEGAVCVLDAICLKNTTLQLLITVMKVQRINDKNSLDNKISIIFSINQLCSLDLQYFFRASIAGNFSPDSAVIKAPPAILK